MKFYTSYFYQVRFFDPHIIPFSTAMWPPHWFLNWKGPHKDKNGVWNGLEVDPLIPSQDLDGECMGPERCKAIKNGNCPFLQMYRKQLFSLDFNKVINRLIEIAYEIKQDEGFTKEPEIAILVYEAPQNICSERRVIQEWFTAHNYPITEWSR